MLRDSEWTSSEFLNTLFKNYYAYFQQINATQIEFFVKAWLANFCHYIELIITKFSDTEYLYMLK